MSKVPGKGGAGLSQRFSDNAPWLDGNDFYNDLLDEIDRKRDLRPLLKVLKVPKEVLPHFEDLFDRYSPLKSCSRRVPSYQRTPHQKKLDLALELMKHLIYKGMSEYDAIEKAARKHGVSRAALSSVYYKTHRSYRHANRRRR
jgi:hypothetical protein